MRQRIEYKLAVLVYRCLNGLAPSYLANDLQCVADLDSRRRLHSSALVDRAFPVATARVWNTLPPEVTSSPPLPAFKRQLKTVLFERSFPGSYGRV